MISLSEYYDRLLKIGMGWLGWTEDQTLDTSMPAIVLAQQGRVEMLQAVFGGAPAPKEPPPEKPMMAAATIMDIFRAAAR